MPELTLKVQSVQQIFMRLLHSLEEGDTEGAKIMLRSVIAKGREWAADARMYLKDRREAQYRAAFGGAL